MDKINFSCKVSTNCPEKPVTLSIFLDDTEQFSSLITNDVLVSFDFDEEDEKEWVIKFVMSGKTDEHTILNSDGTILESTILTISDIKFDEIDITRIIETNPLPYIHNYNGNSDKEINDQFYNVIGCNGEITLKFTTPIYLWLLENM